MKSLNQVFNIHTLMKLTLRIQYQHAVHLMGLANQGVPDARELAQVTLDKYFERVEKECLL